jgi:hypothetical protein
MAIAELSKIQPVATKSITPTFRINTSFKDNPGSASFKSVLPFRVKFTHVHVPSEKIIPAIPFQIIGYSNYIL